MGCFKLSAKSFIIKKKYEIQLKTKEVIGKRVKKLKQIQF